MPTEAKNCRLCQSNKLLPVIDLGHHTLTGQFRRPDEPVPEKAPIQVVRCPECGLVQLRHSVEPEKMFSHNYGYRSSISATMKAHLKGLAEEAADMLLARRAGPICVAPRVLDIGCNNGWLLNCIPFGTGVRTGVDPSDIPIEYPGIAKVWGFFPEGMLLTQKYDLIFTIAMFYDAEDPIGFAKAIKKILFPGGLWVVEVADQHAVLQNVAFDYFVSEHVALHSVATMTRIAQESGLKILRAEPNGSNGGSMRYYLTHQTDDSWDNADGSVEWRSRLTALWSHACGLRDDQERFGQFTADVQLAIQDIRKFVLDAHAAGKRIHLLGGSTKVGAILQTCGLSKSQIEAASDRDERKVGKIMPGLGIPVISEKESRERKPDVYITSLPFVDELTARERESGTKGQLAFLLPSIKVIDL